MQAALGELMTALVIETQDGVTQTRTWLASQHTGRLSVLPLDGVRVGDETRTNEDRALAERVRANGARLVWDGVGGAGVVAPCVAGIGLPRFLVPRFGFGASVDRAVAAWQRMRYAQRRGGPCDRRTGFARRNFRNSRPREQTRVFRKIWFVHGAGTLDPTDALGFITPEEAKANRDTAGQGRDAANRELDTARRALDEATRTRDASSRESANRRNERNNTEAQAARLEENLAVFAGENEQFEQEIAQIDEQAQQAADEATRHEAEQLDVNTRKSAIETQLQETLAGGWLETLNNAHAALASAAEAVRSAEAVKRERLASYADAVKQKETGEVRFVELTSQDTDGQQPTANVSRHRYPERHRHADLRRAPATHPGGDGGDQKRG